MLMYAAIEPLDIPSLSFLMPNNGILHLADLEYTNGSLCHSEAVVDAAICCAYLFALSSSVRKRDVFPYLAVQLDNLDLANEVVYISLVF